MLSVYTEDPLKQISFKVAALVNAVKGKEEFKLNIFPLLRALEESPMLKSELKKILDASTTEWIKLRDITYCLFVEDQNSKNRDFHQLVLDINRFVQNIGYRYSQADLLKAIRDQAHIPDQNPTSYLENRKFNPLDPKSLAHIHAGPAIKNSEWEGYTYLETLQLMIKYLSGSTKVGSPQVQTFILLLVATINEKYNFAPKTAQELHETKHDFCEALRKILSSADCGKTLLFPFGWTGTPGHAIYLQAIRTDENHFKVIIFNSGSGLDYHDRLIIDGTSTHRTCLELEGVPQVNLTNDAFLTAWLELLTVQKTNRGELTNYSREDIYEGLILSLGGKRVVPSTKIEDYTLATKAGVCTWGALVAAARYNLNESDFRRVHFEIRLNSLCDFFQSHKDRFADESELLLLAEKSCEQFARDVLLDLKQETISKEEAMRVHATLKEMFSHLEHARQWAHYQSHTHSKIDLTKIDQVPLLQMDSKSDLPPEPALKQAALQPSRLHALYNDFEGIDHVDTLLPKIIAFRTWCEQFPPFAFNVSLSLSLEKFYEKLKTPTAEKNFWNQLTNEQATQCMHELVLIGEIAFKNAPNEIEKRYHYLAAAMGSLKSTAILWSLARKINPPFMDGAYFPLQELLSHWFLSDSRRKAREKNVYDAEMRAYLNEIVNYFRHPNAAAAVNEKLMSTSFCPGVESFTIVYFNKKGPNPKDVIYADQQLDDLEFRNSLFKEKPGLISKSREDQLTFLLRDLEGLVMPPIFCYLRKQILLASCLAVGRSPKELYKDNRISFPIEDNLLMPITLDRENVLSLEQSLSNLGLFQLLEISRSLNVSPEGHFSYSASNAKRLEKMMPPGVLAFLLQHCQPYTPEEMKELLVLMPLGDGDGKDPHLEAQVITTLSYFKKNLLKLQNPDFQEFFRLLVFEHDHLEVLLKNNPQLALILIDFIKTGLDRFADLADFSTPLFFIELSRTFEKIVQNTLGKTVGEFPDPLRFLRLLLLKPDLSVEFRVFVYKHLAASYTTHGPQKLHPKEVEELLHALSYIRKYDNKTYRHSLYLQKEFDTSLIHFQEQIKETIQEVNGDEILSKICERLGLLSTKATWDKNGYPLCTTCDGLSLDLSTGNIYQQNQKASSILKNITENHQFIAAFGRYEYDVQVLNDGQYVFKDKLGIDCKVEVCHEYGEMTVKCKKQIEGVWFQFDKLINHTIFYRQTVWRPLQNNYPYIWLLSEKEHRPTYRVCEDKVEKIHHDGKWAIGDPDSSNNPFGRKLFLFKNETGELKLENPSYGLTFYLRKQNQKWTVLSKEYPGYRYALNQHVKGLEGFTEGFVLENEKGHRKLLLPKRPIVVDKGAFALQVEFVKPDDKIPEMMLFDIDPKRGVVPTTKEQQLMLAYIQFGRKEYITAQENLRKSLSHAIPYTANEQEILKWIFNLNSKMEDGDPASLALTLTALCLMIQGFSNLDLHEVKIDWEKQSDLFFEYIICRSPSTALTVDEEKILITHLLKIRKYKLKEIEEELEKGKADDNFNDELMLEKIKLEEEIDNLSQRHRFLTQSQANQKVQSRSASLMPARDYENEDFKTLVKYMNVSSLHEKEQYPLLTRPGDFFRQRILEDKFYRKIREHDPGARVILNLARRDQSVPRLLIEVLDAVWQKPDAFPSNDYYLKNPDANKEEWLSIIETAKKNHHNDFTTNPKELPSLTVSQGSPASTPALINPCAFLKMPPLTEYETHFEEVDFVGIKLTTEEIKELKQAVDISNKSPLAAVKSQELQKDIEAAWSKTPQKRPYLRPQEAILLQRSLQKKLKLENDLLAHRTKELLALANAAPQDPKEKAIRGLDRQGGILRPVTFNDLCLILARNDAGTLKKLNPTLADHEIQAIYEQTLMVLERAKRVQRIERTLVDLDNLLQRQQETTSDLTKDLIYLDLSQRIRDQLTRPTAYDPVENPEYSLFEYIANIQLFEGQVQDLKELNTERVRLILQKIMGSGKSKVYLPLLALKKADGKTLTVVVVPAFQYDTTLRDMEASSGQIFAQVTHTLKFNRESDCSESGLRKLRENLQELVAKKEYLVVTDKTIHCLIDKAKEMTLAYFELGEPLPPVPPALKEMRLLLKMFRKGILDEVDLILNGRHEVNFTIGEPQSVKKEHAAVVRALYDCLFNKDLLEKIIPENSAEATLTPEQFKQEVLPELAKAIFERQFKEIKEKDLIIDYWMNGIDGDAFVAKLEDEKLQNRLAIVKEELMELLPITLCKTINLRYGKSDDGSELLAVPYVGNNKPSPTSRFGNPYELLNFTTQLYLLQGVQENTLRPLVDKLKMRAIRELTADPELKKVTNTLAYQEFLALCDDKNMNLMCVMDSDFKKIVLRYKDNKTAVLDFLERYIYPLVAIHPGKITSHHLSLVELFEDEIIGFTGTPWNSDLFHAHLRVHFETGADGKTLGILKKNSSADIIHLNTHKHGEIFEELFKGHDETSLFRTLQDTGSIFNGIDNRLIAEEILKRAPAHIKGVKFFAENNQVEILERGKKESVPLSKCQLTPEECFTYYDQWHTTSTDIKQMRNAKGFVTIGKTLNSRDLRQGVWRLREIDKCQIAALVVAPEAATLIRAELGMKPEEKITFDAIIKFNEINLNRELENQLPSNVLQKVNHVTEHAIWRILSDPETDLSKMAPSIPLLKEILRRKQEDTPYKNFGRKEESVETAQLLKEKIQSDWDILASLKKKNAAEFAKIDQIKHKENIEKAIPHKVLPARMNRPIRINRELTIEVEREQDKEKEVNVLRIKELENATPEGELRRDIIPHWNWSTATQSSPTKREFFRTWTMNEIAKLKKEDLPKKEDKRTYTESQGIPPTMTLQELFANSKGFHEYADVFCLETTYNFLPMTSCLKSDVDVIQRAVPFDSLQLDAEHFLILQDRKTKERRMLLLAPAEMRYFMSQLGKEKHKNVAEKEISIVFGDTEGVVWNSDDDAVAQEIVNSPEWIRCITEVKFFNGELDYKRKEQEYLMKWIKAKGVERMETLFFQRILRHKPEQKKEYSGSILNRIFNGLIKS